MLFGELKKGSDSAASLRFKVKAVMMQKKLIETDKAPPPLGPYTQAIQIENRVYLSGQIPIDPKTMELVEGDPRAHVEQALENIKAVVEVSGATLNDIVKINVFLIDITYFDIVNDVFNEYFSNAYPVRSLIVVSALPKNAIIEIDAMLEMVPD